MEEIQEKVNADTIIDWLKQRVESKQVQFDTKFFIETAFKLNSFLGDKQDRLVDLEQAVAELKINLLSQQDKKNVSEVELKIKASKEYGEWKKQDMKCQRIEEFIRLAKKMSDRSAGY